MIGTLLNNRYHIDSKLGEGGMGIVYKAHDTVLNRPVALKLLPAELTTNEDRVHRFEQEARAASALNHPNILTIYEVGQAEVGHFMATEFVDGATLRDLLSTGKLDFKKLCEIAAQVADALAVAHRAGIIHRDIKPENVMVRRDGYAKLLDFGLAKLTEETPAARVGRPAAAVKPVTVPGMVVGSIQYLSPEQAAGRSVDHRSDLFSMGCVLYEMATDQAAFGGESVIEVLQRITSEQPRPVREVNTFMPLELQRIVEKCLAKDPNERYQHADELAVDLRRLMRTGDSGVRTDEKVSARPRRRGKPMEFEDVVRPHLEYLYAFAVRLCGNRTLAEDLVQDALLRAFRGFPRLRNRERPRLWLTRVLTCCYHDRFRADHEADKTLSLDSNGRIDLFDTIIEEDPFPYSDRVHLDFLELFDDVKVIEVLQRLHPAHRTALILAYIYGYKAREIAEITSKSVGTVLAWLFRGRKQLERELWAYARSKGLIAKEDRCD